MNSCTELKDRVERLGLRGVAANWEDFGDSEMLRKLVEIEEQDRGDRGLQRRIRNAKLGRFKSFSEFDWKWPSKVDNTAVEEAFTLNFLEEASNVILVGPNGVGKTMIAQNLAYEAILKGHTARFITASELLNDLAAQETGTALRRKLKQYSHWKLLIIDEVGYLSTTNRHADLLFEVINRRYQEKSIILTTNKPFSEWNEVFPSATCVVTMVDRLVHKSEIIKIEGDSYRLKEAKEREEQRKAKRKTKRKPARRRRSQE
jgi:DNA replication protein DnaC